MVYLGLAVVGTGAVLAALAAGAFVDGADALALGARTALATPPPSPDPAAGLDLMHVCGVHSDLIRGKQIALLALLAGGVPAAMIAAALAATRRTAERHWPAGWANVFLGGFVFQLCSMLFTAFVFVVLIEPVALGLIAASTLPALGASLAAMVCHLLGLRAWRTLQMSVHDAPPSVVSPLPHM